MTTTAKKKATTSTATPRMSLAQILQTVVAGQLPLRFTALTPSRPGPRWR